METKIEQCVDQIDGEQGNIITWLIEEYKREEEERVEYLRTHFSNGVLRYQFRTEKDRVDNCGRLIYRYIGPDGTEREYREFRCKVFTGPNACQKCLGIRNNQRSGDFSDRIDAVSDRQLYQYIAYDGGDLKRLRESCYKHGYEYVAIPTGNGTEKIVITDGNVKGSVPIHPDDAKTEVSRLGGFLDAKKAIRVSGSLGNPKGMIENVKVNTNRRMVKVTVGGYVYQGVEPTKAEQEIANVKAMASIGEALLRDMEITESNVQNIMSEREGALTAVYLSMGFKRKRIADHTVNIDIDEINKLWAIIETGKDTFRGDLRSVSPFSRMLISRTLDERNSRPDDFASDVDKASKQFTL